jgi:uncharacterized protein YjbI with pentapeptide repeats
LDFLTRDDANHRLAAVQFFDRSAHSSLEYHWLMLDQIPTAIRSWAGPSVSNRSAHVPVVPSADPTVAPVITRPLSDRPERLAQRASASANKAEVVAALWAISGRNLVYERPNRILPRFIQMDRQDNFEDGSLPPQDLTHYRDELERNCATWVGEDSQEAIAELQHPIGTDFPGQRVKRWIILSYINFSFADLNHISLAGIDMTGSQFDSANMAFANFSKITLANARLDEAILWGARLEEADMSRVSAREVDFGSANLRGAWLVGADLAGSNFYKANLDGAFLMGADLSNFETMSGASARRANFWRANLVNARIASIGLKEYLERAENQLESKPDDLAKVRKEVDGYKVDLRQAFFRDADLRGAYFWNVDLDGADFTNAKLDHAEFTDVDLRFVKGLRPEQLSKINHVTRTLLPSYLGLVQ